MRGAWMVAMATVLGLVRAAWPLDTPNERITLVGLTGVHVVVYDASPEREQDGGRRSTLQTDLEQRLRRAGIRPLGADDALKAVGRPTLELRLSLTRSRHGSQIYVYSVALALRQQIQLVRARTTESFAITWSEPPDVGTVERPDSSVVLDAARAKVDQFIAAWRAANDLLGGLGGLPNPLDTREAPREPATPGSAGSQVSLSG